MILFENAYIVCPQTHKDFKGYLLVENGCIRSCGEGVFQEALSVDAERIDCSGDFILPGCVDLLCESGEPDRPWLEGLDNLAKVAQANGFTQLIHGPGLRRAIDMPHLIRDIRARVQDLGVDIQILGAATQGHLGRDLAEMGLMLDAGAISISDGYGAIRDALVLRRVMEYLEPFSVPFVLQPTELALEEGGFMHEGLVSTQIGLHGIPEAAELIGITRAIALCRQTGCRIHLSHITTERGVSLLSDAKAEGLPVTGGVPAVHLMLTDESIRERHYDTALKIRPPLRPERDRIALIEGLRTGVLDMVFSAHHPLSRAEKELEFAEADFGLAGIEQAVLACWEALGDIGLLAKVMSQQPAEIFGLDTGLDVGKPANLVILSGTDSFQNQVCYYSKGTNDPLRDMLFKGRVRGTFTKGRLYQNAVS